MAKIVSMKKHVGIAGQYSYTVVLDHGNGPHDRCELVSSVYGGPIILISSDSGVQYPVSRAVTDRIGTKLNPAWIRAFFA